MGTMSDPQEAKALRLRLERLDPQASRRWGTMDLTAMLCHVGDGLEQALGRRPMPDQSTLLFRTVVKWIVLHLPMPKGAPTAPALDSRLGGTRLESMEAARQRVLDLVDETLERAPNRPFAEHPAFGPLTREQRGVLTWKHIDHHLRQFGA